MKIIKNKEINLIDLSKILKKNINNKKLDNELCNFVKMEDITNKINNHISKEYKDVKNGFSKFNYNDILIAKITPCFENGKGALVDLVDGGFGSTEFMVISPYNESVKDYIYHLTQSKRLRLTGGPLMIGSGGQRRIPKEFILNYQIPYFEDANYLKIGNFLNIRLKRIEKIKNLLEKIEIRNQYYADKLLSGELSINEKNEIYKNNEWKDLIVNGKNRKAMIFAKKVKLEDFKYKTSKGIAGKTGYLEIGDIDINTKKYDITKKDKLTVSGCRFCEKNILVISTVRPQRLGYTITTEDLFISNAFTTIDVSKNKLLEYIIKTSDFMSHISENSEGAIYPTIKESKLLNFEFFYDEQKETKIFDFLKKLDLEKEKVEKLLKLEEQRFEWLSDKLLSGEYVIED